MIYTHKLEHNLPTSTYENERPISNSWILVRSNLNLIVWTQMGPYNMMFVFHFRFITDYVVLWNKNKTMFFIEDTGEDTWGEKQTGRWCDVSPICKNQWISQNQHLQKKLNSLWLNQDPSIYSHENLTVVIIYIDVYCGAENYHLVRLLFSRVRVIGLVMPGTWHVCAIVRELSLYGMELIGQTIKVKNKNKKLQMGENFFFFFLILKINLAHQFPCIIFVDKSIFLLFIKLNLV